MTDCVLGCYVCGTELVIDPYKFRPDIMPLEVCANCNGKPGVKGVVLHDNNYLVYTEAELENYWVCNTSIH